jgi:5-methylcytosine-specific restriction protein B
MSRYCGDTETGPILEASVRWRDVALLGDGSVFTSKNLWTDSNLEELNQNFVQNMDEGDRSFLEKLHDQLEPSSPAAKQLAAEMMWIMYLCPSSLSSTHKREVIHKMWSWSGESFPQPAPMLAENVLRECRWRDQFRALKFFYPCRTSLFQVSRLVAHFGGNVVPMGNVEKVGNL